LPAQEASKTWITGTSPVMTAFSHHRLDAR
jgi:hypothetical protein